jgi:hypothetical protein
MPKTDVPHKMSGFLHTPARNQAAQNGLRVILGERIPDPYFGVWVQFLPVLHDIMRFMVMETNTAVPQHFRNLRNASLHKHIILKQSTRRGPAAMRIGLGRTGTKTNLPEKLKIGTMLPKQGKGFKSRINSGFYQRIGVL